MMPGLLYFLLEQKGKNRYRPLAYYGPKQVAKTFHTKRGKKIPDTLYHQVNRLLLTDQDGKEGSVPDTAGFISILNFSYSACSSCTALNTNMTDLVNLYKHNPRLRYYTISVDSNDKDPGRLKRFKSGMVPDTLRSWNFYAGAEADIFAFARKQLFLDVYRDGKDPDRIIFRQLIVLLDSKDHIRGYYDALSKEQMDKLKDEVKVLIAEELRQVTQL